jgi:hypothetical protein
MAMTFNEFNKELTNRIQDPNIRWFFAYMFEVLVSHNTQMDEMAGLLLNLAEQQSKFAEFNAITQEKLKRVERRGRPDGIEVESVLNKPEN